MEDLVESLPPASPRPPAWREILAPIPRAGAFYAGTWRRWIASRTAPPDGPAVRPTIGLAGQALFDEAVLAGFRLTRSRAGTHDRGRYEREAQLALDLYLAEGWIGDPAAFHPSPPPIAGLTIRAGKTRRLAYERWSFDSGYEPHPDDPGRERWLGYAANRRARVWVLRHEQPRPWLVCVHGAEMGRPGIDLALFRARWLHEDLGLNVALPVLPLHGVRRDGTTAAFPGEDPLDNVHGFAQAVWDVRRLIGQLREDGEPVGVTGVSLGGYVTALLAGVDGGLACAILGVPLVDLLDLVERNAPWRHDPEWQRVMQLARLLHRVVSPLSFPPLVPRDRRFIYAGAADRLVHPRRQVIPLWELWERPDAHWYPGGHIGFFRSPPVGRYVKEALTRSGLVG